MLTKERKKQEVEEKKEAEKNAKIFIYPGIYVFFFFFFFGKLFEKGGDAKLKVDGECG